MKAVEGPPGEVLNVTGLREGKRLQRPEGQRAFDLWKYAFRPEDVARGHDGLREAYDRFLTTNFRCRRDVEACRGRTRRRQGMSRRGAGRRRTAMSCCISTAAAI